MDSTKHWIHFKCNQPLKASPKLCNVHRCNNFFFFSWAFFRVAFSSSLINVEGSFLRTVYLLDRQAVLNSSISLVNTTIEYSAESLSLARSTEERGTIKWGCCCCCLTSAGTSSLPCCACCCCACCCCSNCSSNIFSYPTSQCCCCCRVVIVVVVVLLLLFCCCYSVAVVLRCVVLRCVLLCLCLCLSVLS